MSASDPQQHLLPPQDLEAEAAVLGSIMLDNDCWPGVAATCQADDFYNPDNATALAVMIEMARAERPIDLVTFTDALKEAGQLERVGGADYAVSLLEAVSSAANAVYYAEIVRRASARRQAIDCANVLSRAGHDASNDLPATLRDLRGRMDEIEIKHEGRPRWDAEAVSDTVIAGLDREVRAGVSWSTGLRFLDGLTGGLEQPSVIVMGGRPHHDKTGFAAGRLVPATLEAKRGVVYVTYEENVRAIWRRVVGPLAKASPSRARKGRLEEPARGVFVEWSRWLAEQPFAILESPSLAEIESEVKDRRPSLLVIDTLQAMAHAVQPRKGAEEMRLRLGDLLSFGKSLSNRCNLCVVMLSHVGSESGKSKNMPHKRDLHESRQIEQFADGIWMVWWPRVDYPTREKETLYAERLIVQVQKNRIGGPNGTLAFGIVPHTQELWDLTYDEMARTVREFEAEPPPLEEMTDDGRDTEPAAQGAGRGTSAEPPF